MSQNDVRVVILDLGNDQDRLVRPSHVLIGEVDEFWSFTSDLRKLTRRMDNVVLDHKNSNFGQFTVEVRSPETYADVVDEITQLVELHQSAA